MPEVDIPVGGSTRKMTVYDAPAGGKKYPVVVLVHGNFGLRAPYGEQIRGFARELAALGYATAVPHLYPDDEPHPTDTRTGDHTPTLAAAVAALGGRPGADPARVGLVGYSLGGATCLAHLAASPGRARAFADYFGFRPPGLTAGAANLPPTVIFHNKLDRVVDAEESRQLAALLAATGVEHDLHLVDDDNPDFYHAFQPGGKADTDAKAWTAAWLTKHLPPTGV